MERSRENETPGSKVIHHGGVLSSRNWPKQLSREDPEARSRERASTRKGETSADVSGMVDPFRGKFTCQLRTFPRQTVRDVLNRNTLCLARNCGLNC